MLSCRGGCPCSCDRHYDVSRRDAYVRVILDPRDNRRDNSVIIPPLRTLFDRSSALSPPSLPFFSSPLQSTTRYRIVDFSTDNIAGEIRAPRYPSHVSSSRFSNLFRKRTERRPWLSRRNLVEYFFFPRSGEKERVNNLALAGKNTEQPQGGVLFWRCQMYISRYIDLFPIMYCHSRR